MPFAVLQWEWKQIKINHKSAFSITLTAAACLSIGYFIVLLLKRDFAELVAILIPDDAGYYLQVAWNIAHGNGSTFDGLNPTNGYHPLWLLILIPVYACCHSVEAAFYAFMTVSLLLLFASCAVIIAIFGRVRSSAAANLTGIGCFLLALRLVKFGMESYVSSLCFLCVVLAAIGYEWRVERKFAVWFSLALGLFFLARLDNAFYIMPVGIYYGARLALSLRTKTWRVVFIDAGALVAPLAILVGGFFVWNLWSFEHILTISSTLKSVFPHINDPLPRLTLLRYCSAPFSLLVSVLIVVLSRQPVLRSLARITMLFSCGAVAQVLFLILFQRGIYGWYWINQYVLLSLSFGMGVLWAEERFHDVRGRLLAGGVCGCMLLMAGLRIVQAFNITGPVILNSDYIAACWAKANTPPTSRFGLSWCGVFGHFADRPVINLDGVINSYDYVKHIKRGAFAQYLSYMHIDYLVWDAYVPPNVADGSYEHYKFEPIWHSEVDSNNVTV